MDKVVNTAWLNIRSDHKETSKNRITKIPLGHLVTVLSVYDTTWSEIETNYMGQTIRGYCAGRYLSPVATLPPPNNVTSIIECHREENKANSTVNSRDHWSYPIGEPNRITRDITSTATKKASILSIVDYLDVENAERYRPSRNTYCNIYAHDYAYLCGAYLPRVWWKERALTDLIQGISVIRDYGVTYREMNANSLYEWFMDWSQQFGWKQYFDVEEVQKLADEGKVCICVARRKQSNHSGHIICIIPSHDSKTGIVTANGVFKPLISQAGTNNYKVSNSSFWHNARYNAFGFWVHN